MTADSLVLTLLTSDELEYVTYHPDILIPHPNDSTEAFEPIVPLHLLPPALLGREPSSAEGGDDEYGGTDGKGNGGKEERFRAGTAHFAPYKMKDLTS